jgi:hypothetical protein
MIYNKKNFIYNMIFMMQEHRSLIKRASVERKTAGQASTNFENTLILLHQTLMCGFNEAHFVYCNGP